jgi:hypothetical protein
MAITGDPAGQQKPEFRGGGFRPSGEIGPEHILKFP